MLAVEPHSMSTVPLATSGRRVADVTGLYLTVRLARPRNKAAVITSPIECLMSLLLSCCACMHRSSNLFRRRVDRLAETLHDHLNCAVVDDEWRRNKHVIAVHAVHRAAHGIHHKSAGHRFTLNARMHLQFRLECLLGAAVGDKLYAL